jgi:hypothetical protein
MGMGTAPCSGYVLPATKENFKKLNIALGQFKKEYNVFKEEYPNGHIEGFLEDLVGMYGQGEVIFEATPDLGKAITIKLYRYNSDEGDRWDDLEDGVYFIFDEEELYTKKLTPIGKVLKKIGVLPEQQAWTTFG